jgi:hypothetical protein
LSAKPTKHQRNKLELRVRHSFVSPPRELNDLYYREGIQLSRPEPAFIIAARALLGAEIALLLADWLSAEQRKAVRSILAIVGLVTTIPAVWAVFGKCA